MALIEKLQNVVRQKFRAALPASADNALLAVLGNVLARPGVAERVYGEGEVFLIKAALFMGGVRIDPSACDGVGIRWKEDLGQRHYDPDARRPKASATPHAIRMPHGFFMPLYSNDASPFTLARHGDALDLELDGFRLFGVELEPRPAFYARATSTGVPMRHIGVHRLERQLLVEYNAYCRFFSEGVPCAFCGIVSERPLLPPRHAKRFAASPTEVAEVVEAAFAGPSCTEFQMTGGVLPDQVEVGYFLEVGRAIQERLGVQRIPGSQAVLSPPPKLEDLEGLKAAGWEGVALNLEVWHPHLWQGFAPGKARLIGREKWLRSLEHAAQVFGKGQVACVLVAGLEPKRSYLEGVEWLAERGIHAVPIPWSPAPGSELEGHQTPTAAWHLDLTNRVLDLWEKHGLSAARHSSGGLHYADLARMRQSVKALAADHPERARKDLRWKLAVEGTLPA